MCVCDIIIIISNSNLLSINGDEMLNAKHRKKSNDWRTAGHSFFFLMIDSFIYLFFNFKINETKKNSISKYTFDTEFWLFWNLFLLEFFFWSPFSSQFNQFCCPFRVCECVCVCVCVAPFISIFFFQFLIHHYGYFFNFSFSMIIFFFSFFHSFKSVSAHSVIERTREREREKLNKCVSSANSEIKKTTNRNEWKKTNAKNIYLYVN
mgnify:CR=1 FL=1